MQLDAMRLGVAMRTSLEVPRHRYRGPSASMTKSGLWTIGRMYRCRSGPNSPQLRPKPGAAAAVPWFCNFNGTLIVMAPTKASLFQHYKIPMPLWFSTGLRFSCALKSDGTVLMPSAAVLRQEPCWPWYIPAPCDSDTDHARLLMEPF